MKKKISLLLAVLMIFSIVLTACGSDEPEEVKEPEENVEENEETEEAKSLEDIIESGKIVLGTDADYPPFEFHAMIDGRDEIAGLDIEIAKYIADELDVELEIKEMDFDKLLGGLSTGMLDMAIAGMNPAPDRKANFTDIYYEANLSVLVNNDSEGDITTVEDLNGKSIGVQMGTVQEEIAKDTIEDADVKSLSKNPEIIMNLKTKKIDCAIVETPVANSFAKANDDIMVVEDLIIDNESGGVAIAVKEGNDELTEKLNEILDEIKSKGLIEEWLIEADELSTKDI
ncbi:MAG: transporter substrate-binding domain-containing protein [Tissierella sp.]|uniref:transporter substrate-binding domain-containing protein n=1 Tax=Tissierella sp. TaxID=41274 RepID=UPI003F958034